MQKRSFLLIFIFFLPLIASNVILSSSGINTYEIKVNNSLNSASRVRTGIINLESPANNSILHSGTPVILEIIDSNLNEVWFNWDSDVNNSWLQPYETDLPLGDGLHILHVYTLDVLDNWEAQQFHFVTDDTSPLISLETLLNGTELAPLSIIDFKIIDFHLERILYHWESGNNLTLNSPFRISLPSEIGLHLLTVYASDFAGNWAIERFSFTVRAGDFEDTDNDGLADYYEFLLGTNAIESTTTLNGAPLAFDDLDEDAPNSIHDAFRLHTHISADTWIIGQVSESILNDNSDFYLFSSEIRNTGTVFLQSSLPEVSYQLFDLEGRLNLTGRIFPPSVDGNNSRIRSKLQSTTQYLPNALPYLVEIPIPLAVELLVIQIEGANLGDILYSIWLDENPIPLQPQLFTLLINILLFLLLPFGFFFVLKWENHRVTKHQPSSEDERSSDVIINASFREWIFSSLILLIMVFLFSELSREKFLNQVTVLTAKSFVDLGYRIFILAVTLIFLGSIFSIVNWFGNLFSTQDHESRGSSWRKGLIYRLVTLSLIIGLYFVLWLVFLQLIMIFQAEASFTSILNEIMNLFEVFFTNDLSSPPSTEEIALLTELGTLDLIFIFLTIPLGLYMFILNFSGGTSVRHIFRPLNSRKSRLNYKSVLLGVGLGIELYRVFSNLINYILSIILSEDSTFFFIEISELPWWHQIVTWISQETLISTPILYGLYFELQGIFFAWIIYTSLPTFLRRLMSGSSFSKMIIRIGIFLLGMFVIFLRTLHLLLLIPIGVTSFPFSAVLSDPFSILILLAMISEILEIIGFSLGLLLVVYYRKIHKQVQKDLPLTPLMDPQLYSEFEEE